MSFLDDTSGHVYVIAEVGVNHNGDPALAKKLVDIAADCGADAVKFQLFRPEEIAGADAPLAEYQERSGEQNQLEMLQGLTITHDDYRELVAHATQKGIDCIITAFDLQSAEFIASLDVPAIKIPSGEVTNIPFLRGVAKLGKPVILSTGMATIDEIKEAVDAVTAEGIKVSILHCTSSYPTPMEQVNLRVMDTLREEFSVPVGLSDHSEGIEVPTAAAALGAVIVEKHFTLDRTMQGPDHKASIEPKELANMVSAIRNVTKALGSKDKVLQACEIDTANVARRSIIVDVDVQAGQQITKDIIVIRRPGTGIAPKHVEEIIGKTVTTDLPAGTPLTWDHLS